jgi:hypothetical protein
VFEFPQPAGGKNDPHRCQQIGGLLVGRLGGHQLALELGQAFQLLLLGFQFPLPLRRGRQAGIACAGQ